MENLGISKEKLVKIKDGIIFILLFLWMVMPIFQTIKKLYSYIDIKEIYFGLMKTIRVVGIAFGIITVILKIKNSGNKKQTVKELLPIFILILYMVWTWISCMLSSNTYVAFNGSYYRKEGYYMYLNYAGYFFCAFLLESKNLRKIILNAFVISAVYLITISRLSLLGAPFSSIFVNNSVENTVFAQFNHYCYFLIMALMCCLGLYFKEKNKILKTIYMIMYLVICYAMIYNDTFGSYLAGAVTLILYSIYALIKKKDKIGILIAVLIFILLSIFTYKNGENVAIANIENFIVDIKAVVLKITGIDLGGEGEKEEWQIRDEFMSAGTNRGALWSGAFQFIQKNPIIGYGSDNLAKHYSDIGLIGSDRPHNLILYLACVSGIPGLLLYITAIGIIVIKGIIKLFKNNGHEKIYLLIVIAYLISAMFGNSMFYISPFFFIFLGNLMKCNLEKM